MENKQLINEFFYLALCSWLLYSNEHDKWKILPEFNSMIKRLHEINKELINNNENFERMILDLQTTADMSSNDENFLSRYKDFILSFNHK